MKKIYKEPTMTVIMLQIANHLLMNLSYNSEEADGDGFTKDEGDWDELWDD